MYAYQLNPKGDNYNVAVSYRVRGNFDKASNTAKLSYTKLRFITTSSIQIGDMRVESTRVRLSEVI